MSDGGRNRKRTFAGGWINAAATPVYMLDDRNRIVFFNQGCEALTGWTFDDVQGQTCVYSSDADDELTRLTGSLCPPPDVSDGATRGVPVHIARREGGTVSQFVNFFPLEGDNGKLRHVLAVVTPIQPLPAPASIPVAQRLHAELAALRSRLRDDFGMSSLVGECPAMQTVLAQVRLAATSSVSVFLHGETGTGREHLARVIHNESDNSRRSFVPLDCSVTPAVDLKMALRRIFDSERDEPQALHLQCGSLLFGAVESLQRDVQELVVQLYNAADESRPRLLASSQQTPAELLESGNLLPEFIHLTSTLPISVPALRARGDDVELLAQHFVEQHNRTNESQIAGFDGEVLSQFRKRNWPGNVAELRQVIVEACAASSGTTIEADDLTLRFRAGLEAQRVGPAKKMQSLSLDEHLMQIEAEFIREALASTGNKKSKAAELLGMTRAKLYRRMEQLGIGDA